MTRTITDVEVTQLFGRYDYRIRFPNDDTEMPKIALLYGDNGTGKTTILKLIFHLLSSSLGRQHKSFVASVPFRQFSILFSDGYRLTASRPNNHAAGSFDLQLADRDRSYSQARIEIDPESRSVTRQLISKKIQNILRSISELDVAVLYLGDNRDLEGDTLLESDRRRHVRRRMSPQFRENDAFSMEARGNEAQESNLVESIHRTESDFNIEVIRASSTGESDAGRTYIDILRTIASAKTLTKNELDEKVETLTSELEELEGISEEFAEFGFGSTIDADSLARSLLLATETEATLAIAVEVLASFLNGQRVRLNALRPTYEKISRFVRITNEYLIDKSIRFDIYDGLSIHIHGDELNPDLLSSGERHLLLLFLNVLISSDGTQLFIIDEPELSLNAKWQRRLVDSLVELSGNSKCQFLMATHSIELLAKHSEHVMRLNPHGKREGSAISFNETQFMERCLNANARMAQRNQFDLSCARLKSIQLDDERKGIHSDDYLELLGWYVHRRYSWNGYSAGKRSILPRFGVGAR